MKMLVILVLVLSLPHLAMARPDHLSKRQLGSVAPFLGWYQGAFDTALTADPLDDININSCSDCELHADPLKDIYLQLLVEGKQLRPSFHRQPRARAFDLLGKYCHSAIGELKKFSVTEGQGRNSGDDYRVLAAIYAFDAGRCPRNITENKDPELSLEIMENLSQGTHMVKLEIDKDLRRVVSLTAKNSEGERVPVKSNPDDYGKGKRHQRSYLYEDELGEYTQPRSDRTETRSFAIPIVFGDYVGANVTWWPHKVLDVEADTEQVLTRHTAVFFPLASDTP